MSPRVRDGLVAGAWAAVLSGGPSTLHALLTRRDLLATVRAAGSIAVPNHGGAAQLAAAPFVHGALSLGWGVVLAHVLPRRHGAVWGGVAGLGIAAVSLGVIGRRVYPQIRDLPQAPQIADHVAFGTITGWVLAKRTGQPPV